MAKTKRTCAKSRSRPSKSGSSEPSAGASSGATSRSSSVSPSTLLKGRVGNYDISTLPVAWDNHPVIRDRCRENLNLSLRYEETGKHGNGHVEATKESLKQIGRAHV